MIFTNSSWTVVVATTLVAALPAASAWYFLTTPPATRMKHLLHIFNGPVGYYLYRWAMLKKPNDVADGIVAGKEVITSHRRILAGTNDYEYGPFKLVPVPYSEDNYGYIILDTEQDIAVVIDPADPTLIQLNLSRLSPTARIKATLTTHHHWDHSAGNLSLWLQHFRRGRLKKSKDDSEELKVFGGIQDFPLGGWTNAWWHKVNVRVGDGEEFQIGRMRFRAITTPCHTKGSIMYYFDPNSSLLQPSSSSTTPNSNSTTQPHKQQIQQPHACLFTGDTLFVGGCGKFFEGHADDMRKVIAKLLARIPGDTLVWPGHEYALSNLRFAKRLEPGNLILQMKLQSVEEHYHLNVASIPTSFGEECQYNPYLRIEYGTGGVSELWKSIVEYSSNLPSSDNNNNKLTTAKKILQVVRNGSRGGGGGIGRMKINESLLDGVTQEEMWKAEVELLHVLREIKNRGILLK